MNKQKITKSYSTILLILALVSMLIMFITPFTPAFKIEFLGVTSSDTGMDYVAQLFDGNYESDFKVISEDYEKWIFCCLVIVMLILTIVKIIKILSQLGNMKKASFVNHMMSNIKLGMGCNITYFVVCMYFIIKYIKWENILDLLSGDAYIKTQAFAPMVMQILIFIVAKLLYKHWNKALDGQSAPLSFGVFGGTAQTQQFTYTEQPNTQSGNSSQPSTQNEMEKLELLKKYKELLDSGIITKEEFEVKKKELLESNPRARTSANGAQASDNFGRSEQAQEELSKNCHECGYPMGASQQVCPHCGTPYADDEEEALPMKWYNFLIYFLLFASAAGNAILGIMYITGGIYGDVADYVYDAYPDLQLLGLCSGIISIIVAILALRTRSALYWYKESGPKLLCILYISVAIANILFMAGFFVITSTMVDSSSIIGGSLIYGGGGIVMAIINHIYFKKRKDMFTY